MIACLIACLCGIWRYLSGGDRQNIHSGGGLMVVMSSLARGGGLRITKPRRAASHTYSAGFSLVEVLVSIFILSVGLLGMVGLQAYALQANREARLQSAGVALARDLAEMVRGNRFSGTGNPYIVDTRHKLTPAVADYCLSVGSHCATPDAIGNSEMTEWLARVDEELPAARVVVCLDDAPYDGAGVPRWPCTAAGAGSQMVVKIGWTRATFNRLGTTAGAVTDRATRPSIVLTLTAGSTGT